MTNPKYKTAAHRAARRRLIEVPIARQGYVNCVLTPQGGRKVTKDPKPHLASRLRAN